MAAMNAVAGSADWHPAGEGVDESVPTSTAHAGIDAASDHLAAIVVARPDMDTTLTAAEVMHRDPRTVRADALGVEAAELMEQHRVNSLLVVDADGRLAGALTINDLMRAKVI